MVKLSLKRSWRAAFLAVIFALSLFCLTACKGKNQQTQADQSQGTQTPGDQPPGDQTPGDQPPGDQTPGDQTPGDQTPGDQTPGGQTPGGQTPGNQTPGNQTPGDNTPHTHTYAEQFSCDAEKHWHQATCEHTEEVRDLGAHQFGGAGGKTCQICGYQNGKLLVKTNSEGQKYTRTKPIHDMLKLGFMEGENQSSVQMVQAQKRNIESYVIRDGQITVKVCAVVNNLKYTNEITIPLDESPIGVEAFFSQTAGKAYMLNGVVVGFSARGTNNEVILADKQTGKLVAVNKIGEGKLVHGGYSLPGIEIGDEITIPVSLIKESQSSTSANSAKLYAEYKGGTDYHTAVVSKNNQVKYAGAEVVIDSQADLVAFMSAGSRENNHYKIVKFKGKMNFVMDSTYENYNFWFSDKKATSSKDIQINNVIPCFNDPSLYYTIGVGFSDLVFGAPHHAAVDYAKPLSVEVEITAVFLGGNTTHGQFLVLDQSWVTN